MYKIEDIVITLPFETVVRTVPSGNEINTLMLGSFRFSKAMTMSEAFEKSIQKWHFIATLEEDIEDDGSSTTCALCSASFEMLIQEKGGSKGQCTICPLTSKCGYNPWAEQHHHNGKHGRYINKDKAVEMRDFLIKQYNDWKEKNDV